LIQGPAFEEGHDDEKIIVVVANFQNGTDTFMADLACRQKALKKALAALKVIENLRAHEFDRNQTTFRILSLVNRAHAAAADRLQDSISA
jgi:hypothetical protein